MPFYLYICLSRSKMSVTSSSHKYVSPLSDFASRRGRIKNSWSKDHMILICRKYTLKRIKDDIYLNLVIKEIRNFLGGPTDKQTDRPTDNVVHREVTIPKMFTNVSGL